MTSSSENTATAEVERAEGRGPSTASSASRRRPPLDTASRSQLDRDAAAAADFGDLYRDFFFLHLFLLQPAILLDSTRYRWCGNGARRVIGTASTATILGISALCVCVCVCVGRGLEPTHTVCVCVCVCGKCCCGLIGFDSFVLGVPPAPHPPTRRSSLSKRVCLPLQQSIVCFFLGGGE